MKNPKVTLSDVAVRAGMSQATASRALRGLKVHRKYQGKAEAAAAELGYVLNEAARSLRAVRTMTVGLVYHDLTSMLGMELLRSIAAGLDDIGYSLFVATGQGKNDHFDQLVHRFLQRRVDALVCVLANGEGAALEGFAAAGLPVMALISKAGGYKKLPLLAPSVERAAKECAARIKALGHERLAVVTPGRATPPIELFITTAKAKRMKVERLEINPAAGDDKAMLKGLMSRSAPTVLLAPLAEAIRLYQAAASLKIKVPADLSIIAMRDRSAAQSVLPANFSTIHIDPAPLGKLAAETLKAWLIEGVALKHDLVVDTGAWIERDTTGPVRA